MMALGFFIVNARFRRRTNIMDLKVHSVVARQLLRAAWVLKIRDRSIVLYNLERGLMYLMQRICTYRLGKAGWVWVWVRLGLVRSDQINDISF